MIHQMEPKQPLRVNEASHSSKLKASTALSQRRRACDGVDSLPTATPPMDKRGGLRYAVFRLAFLSIVPPILYSEP